MGEFSIAVLSLAGCVFAASAAAKFHSRQAYPSFRDGLSETRLFPGRLLSAAAASLSGAEAVIAAGLLAAAALTAAAAPSAAWITESALAAAAVLAATLVAGVAVVLRLGIHARCACFGAHASRPLGRVHLARNLSLLVVICAGSAGVPLAHGRPAPAGAVLAAAAGAVAALVFIRWEDLAELFAPIPPSMAAPAVRRPDRRHS